MNCSAVLMETSVHPIESSETRMVFHCCSLLYFYRELGLCIPATLTGFLVLNF